MRFFLVNLIVFSSFYFMPTAYSQEQETILRVEGDRNQALSILSSKGIKAVELQGTDFLLPSVALDGPDGIVEYGEMIHLKASVDRSKLPEHLSSLKYQWTVFEDGKPKRNFIVWPDGTQIFFAAGMRPKKITVILDIDCLFEIKKPVQAVDKNNAEIPGSKVVVDGKVVTEVVATADINSPEPIVREIVVGGNLPTPVPPTPTPTPTPGPSPVPPTPTPAPSLQGFAKIAFDLANEKVPANAKQNAVALGNSFLNITERINQSASKLAAGVALTAEDLKLDVRSILAALKTSNSSALGANASSWEDWDKAYGDAFYEAYSRSPMTYKEIEVILRETAQGLKEVK